MAFSALDSRLLGPLFATPTMRSVFCDRARLAAMLQAEAALARAQARREAAHRLIEQAAEKVRRSGATLREVLKADVTIRSIDSERDIEAGFDLKPAIEAAALWTDRAVAEARRVAEGLSHDRHSPAGP